MSDTLYVLPGDSKAFKAVIAADIVGYPLDVKTLQFNEDGTVSGPSPTNLYPCLETPNGVITESNAICRYIARSRPQGNLYGYSFFASAQIDSYIDWSLVNLEVPALLQILPLLGRMDKNYQVIKKAKEDFRAGLQKLETDLALRTFIVGDRLSLADIVIGSILYYPMKILMDAEYRREFPNLTRYFSFLVATPNFAKTVGLFVPCVIAKDPLRAGGKGGKGKQKKQKKQKQPKQQQKKKKQKQQPKKKKKPEPKKEEDPLKAYINKLRKNRPKIPIDDWKRQYSNPPGGKNDNYSAMPWFWENYNPEEYSLWLQDFKYQDENKIDFMTNNKAKGFMQRSDGIRKQAFGVMQVLDDTESKGYYRLKGVWLIQGTSTDLIQLANPEFETFNWTKLDSTNCEHKKLVEDYWCSNCEKECDGSMSDDWAIFR